MAPEQAMGRDVDGRADQYALAVVGYQLLTGTLLFDGDSAHTIIFRHVSEEAPRVTSLRSEVPPAVDAALAKALAKDPDARFRTMEDFAAALRSVHAVPVPAHRAPSTRALNAPTVRVAPVSRPRRSRRLAALATIMVLTVVSGAGAWIALDDPPPDPETVSRPPGNVAQQQGSLADESARQADQVSQPVVSSPLPPPTTDTADSLTSDSPVVERPIAPGSRLARLRNARAQRTAGGNAGATEERRVAPLTVASEPYGTLFVDGVEIGDTPVANHPLPVGRRVELRVEREGYRTRRETILVRGPNPVRRRYILEPETP
jgi:hypothetical protein